MSITLDGTLKGKSCVYWIRKPEHTDMTSEGYIGVTSRYTRRLWEHLTLDGNRHLKFAIDKYGWDNLVKSQIVIAEENYCLDLERKLRPENDIGWNCVMGGGKPPVNVNKHWTKGMQAWNKGISWSDDTKKVISEKVSKLWENPEYRQHMSDAHKGQVGAMKGKKHSLESIEKMRLSKIGKKQSQETIEKRRAKAIGRAVPKIICPHCQKSGGIGAMRRWHLDNCKGKAK